MTLHNPFPPRPVFSCPSSASKVHPCTLLIIVSSPFLLSPLCFPFTLPCRIVFTKPDNLEIRPNFLGFRFLAVRFVMISYGCLDLSANILIVDMVLVCSVNFGSISFQRPASFSLTLLSRSMTHRHAGIWIRQGSASVSPLTQEIGFSLYILASAWSELQRPIQSLTDSSGSEP